ncbi:MAG: metal ABC transporter permease [Clostridia bacterium]|nr:metal ABC transporter permease [Clostridia bacterium]
MTDILSVFSYSFMTNAFGAGLLISVCAALLGVVLVLKRYSMIGDGLSHVGFGAMSIAAVTGLSPIAVSIPIVAVTAMMLIRIKSNSRIKGDAAIGLISTGALAFGIIIVSLGGVNTDLNSYLFGSILSLSTGDTILCVSLCLVTLILFVLMYNKIFSVTFDEEFAKACGTRTAIYNTVIAILTAVTVVLGMRMMGTLLISALIIFPALTSMRIFKTFKAVSIFSVAVAVFCFFSGMMISFAFSTPAGATVAAVNIVLFIICFAFSCIKSH